ncbi:MAG: hypothetical protein Q4C95_05465 [Planctomycetia bacterium]|nr:hypothetical protein [Planctomycetia bacterium]
MTDAFAESIDETKRITGVKVREIAVDKDYKGHNCEGSAKVHVAGSSYKGLTR